MFADWIDRTLLLHALAIGMLAWMIFNAAWKKHQRRIWRQWPPVLLTLWGFRELTEASIYLRRYISQRFEVESFRYEGGLSLTLNILSLIAIVALAYRIRRGDIDEEGEVGT